MLVREIEDDVYRASFVVVFCRSLKQVIRAIAQGCRYALPTILLQAVPRINSVVAAEETTGIRLHIQAAVSGILRLI